MSDWLANILEDAQRRDAERPEWAKSDHARAEIARLRRETEQRLASAPPATPEPASGRSPKKR
jgi:hypothetical protein